jgi:flagellar protein FliO/FliZ
MNLLNSPLLAAAAPNGENTPVDLIGPANDAHAAGGGSLVRTIVGLAIVLAVIFGLRWVMKQVKSSREERGEGSGLTAMASLPLGSNRSLHVVRAGREVLVVGSGEHGVTPVRSYDEDEARRLGILAEEQAVQRSSFVTQRITSDNRDAAPAAVRALDTVRAWTVRG